MFSGRFWKSADEEQKDIFAPVSDLMVGVVFIFIILILALSLDLSTENTVPESAYNAKVAELAETRAALKASEARANDLAADNAKLVAFVRFVRDSRITPLMERLSQSDQTRTAILTNMQGRLATMGVDVKIDPDTGTLSLPSSRLFASGQAEPLVPDGRDTILRLGQAMADVLPCYAPSGHGQQSCPEKGDFSDLSAVYVEGHTDITPYGAANGRFRNNWDLSAGRAIEAYTLIRDHFDQLRALKNPVGETMLGVSGYADTRPADRNVIDRTQPQVAEHDRRIEVRVIMSTNEQLVGSILNELDQRLEAVDGIIR